MQSTSRANCLSPAALLAVLMPGQSVDGRRYRPVLRQVCCDQRIRAWRRRGPPTQRAHTLAATWLVLDGSGWPSFVQAIP